MSAFLDVLVEHENHQPRNLTGPSKIVPRDVITTVPPSEYELSQLQWGRRLNGPHIPSSYTIASDVSKPETPVDLERSVPHSPKHQQGLGAVIPSATDPYMNRWRLSAAGVMFFLMGLNDGATGALIPYIERFYHIGYALVSLIFVTNAIGFIVAAPLVQIVDSRWGRSRAYVLATGLMIVGYIILVCAPPFPIVVIAFFCLGFGMGLFLAMTNIFIVNLLNGTIILGAMHGLYGVGGIVAPLIATAMVSKDVRWSFYYFITLGLAMTSTAFLGWSYRGYEDHVSVQLMTALERTASRQAESESGKMDLLGRALKNKTTLLGAMFIFFYQGAEVAISGWVISYLIHDRQGNPAQVGNVTSGFWAGITVGRFVLTHFAHKIGEKTAVFGLVAGAGALQLVVWMVPSVIGDAVAESLVGLLLGPVYPCATAIFSKLLPRGIQINSLSFITSMGSSGGAAIPFLTGLLSQKLGTVVLHPIVVISVVVMEASWLLLPRVNKRTE